MHQFTNSPLYPIIDSAVAARHGWRAEDVARACFAVGVQVVQLRHKAGPDRDFLALADSVVAAARPYGASVIINDRVDVAQLARATGVHVGQGDLPASAARQLLGPDAAIGLSTHTETQILAAVKVPISYLAIGPIFETATKRNTSPTVGLEMVRYAVEHARGLPVVAIGGIRLESAAAVIEAGASAVAVISDLFVSTDPGQRARQYLEMLGS